MLDTILSVAALLRDRKTSHATDLRDKMPLHQRPSTGVCDKGPRQRLLTGGLRPTPTYGEVIKAACAFVAKTAASRALDMPESLWTGRLSELQADSGRAGLQPLAWALRAGCQGEVSDRALNMKV